MVKTTFVILLLAAMLVHAPGSITAQESDGPQFILEKERSVYFQGHTQGFGMGYQQGRIVNIYSTLQWQAEFVTMKHPKEYKRTNESFPNMLTYSYGKLNRVYMLRGGAGFQRIITDKPYYGGVQVRYNLFGGVNLSVAEPVYLYILYYSPSENDFYQVLERYDPDKHFTDNILRRGPIGTGLKESKLYPGLYLKGGLNFDYGADRQSLSALEVGATLDAFPKKIPVMAFARNPHLYFTLYIALHIGQRK
jgi:hypothetical protein